MNIAKYVTISHHSLGITMRYRIGQSQDTSADIINDIGIIRILEDSDSQRQAMWIETAGKIVPRSLDTTDDIL